MSSLNLTKLAHEHWQNLLRPGDVTIDATAGNGHDTAAMLAMVSDAGHVHAFDIQASAIANTKKRTGSPSNLTLHHCGHELIAEKIPEGHWARVKLVAFNLGYLPGSDKTTTTQAESTLAALQEACKRLQAGGLISVIAYRAHEGGAAENEAVQKFLNDLNSSSWTLQTIAPSGVCKTIPPQLYLTYKKTYES